jgi:hypothetical protein
VVLGLPASGARASSAVCGTPARSVIAETSFARSLVQIATDSLVDKEQRKSPLKSPTNGRIQSILGGTNR